ncbi:hypothetical protein THIOSC13_1420003 [uncultured Thiomicrorhabdus sp.]
MPILKFKEMATNWRENLGGNNQPTIVSGTASYSLPSDFARIDTVLFGDNILNITTKEATRRSDGESASSSEPSHYYIEGSNIVYWPTPNVVKTANIDYRKRLTSLSVDADTIDFNTDFDQALVNYAAYLSWNGYRGASGNGQIELAAYEKQMETLKQTYLIFAQENLKFNTQIAGYNVSDDFANNSR